MRDPLRILGAMLALLVAGAPACGSSTTSGTSGTSGGSSTTTSPSICGDDPRPQPYAVGLEGSSADGAVTITFLDADPAPPAKGNNTLKIALSDPAGKPISGATIVTKPYMPDHGHSSSIKPASTPMSESGTYEIKPVTLFMPGVWEITFEVTPPGAAAASAVKFTFCVEG